MQTKQRLRMIILSKIPYGTLGDTKLENSIKRSIIKLEKEGISVGDTCETRHYTINYNSFLLGTSWQSDSEALFMVTDKRTGKRYRARHCTSLALYSGANSNSYYWIFREDNE